MRVILAAVLFGVVCCPAESIAQTRIDLYDKASNRTGYAVIDPRTGRVDFFDKYSNRTGYAVTQPPLSPPPGTPPRPLEWQPIPHDRKGGLYGR